MPQRDTRNTDLLQAMAALADGEDDAKLRVLYRALRGAIVVVVPGRTNTELAENQFFLPTYEDKSGRSILIAYTGLDVAPSDRPRVWMPFAELCKQVVPSGLAIHINPGQSQSGIAPANWVRAIAEGAAEMPDPVRTLTTWIKDVEVSPAPDVRMAIRERLIQGLQATRGVVEAYLAYATANVGEPPILALCVVVVPAVVAEGQRVATELHAWVRPLMGDEEIDFLVLPPEDRRLLPKFKSVGRPFYRNPAN
jgi:hypothetical protein